jgi:hypothetical protein
MNVPRVVVGLLGLNAVLVGALLVQSQRAYAARPADIVRARAIEMVDEHGQVRAQLKVENDGEAVFRLRDSKGEIRVKLGADREGSGLVLMDGGTEPAVQVLAKSDGPSLTLRGQGGQARTITP